MQLSEPPIGLTAVEAFYAPIQPQLIEEAAQCGSRVFHITAHRKAMPNILAFFREAEAQGLAGLIHTFDGCYVNRPKRLSHQLSMHGRGAAFDINAQSNEQGTEGNMPQALVEIGKSLGFFWGGDFAGRYRDAMHFQLGVDFPLNGRPVPHLTWHPAAAGFAQAPSPPNQAPSSPYAVSFSGPVHALKVFDSAGRELPRKVELVGTTALVRVL